MVSASPRSARERLGLAVVIRAEQRQQEAAQCSTGGRGGGPVLRWGREGGPVLR